MTNGELVEMAGGLTYFGVSRVKERFDEKLKKDKKLDKDLETLLTQQTVKCQGLTP